MTFSLKMPLLHSGSYVGVFQQNKWKLKSSHPVHGEGMENANSWIKHQVTNENLKRLFKIPWLSPHKAVFSCHRSCAPASHFPQVCWPTAHNHPEPHSTSSWDRWLLWLTIQNMSTGWRNNGGRRWKPLNPGFTASETTWKTLSLFI